MIDNVPTVPVVIPLPPADDFENEFEHEGDTLKITPIPIDDPVDHCPRCGLGLDYYISYKSPCKDCDYPGLKSIKEGSDFEF